jgi:hypothetical protein
MKVDSSLAPFNYSRSVYGFCLIFFFCSQLALAQEDESTLDYKISFASDVKFTSSGNDSRKESESGIGTLGLRFERGYIYGGANFTVFSQNDQISTDSLETKIFGTNLLIPENSSNRVSNFYFSLGTRTFFTKTKNMSELPTFSEKRFGANLEFKLNNNIWSNDSVSTPITINTFNFNVTYLLLNIQIAESEERVKLMLSGGMTLRRIGGDMALESYAQIRKSFLGTENLAFNGTNFGARLEVSKFYGEMNLTSFKRSDNILGFSGNQSIITLGLIAELRLIGKDKGVTAMPQ